MSNSILNRVHNIQLEILNEVDKICRQNDITYHLYAGSLLGAVRHQGFIPWDDDIDISMTRTNYNKFIEIWSKTNNSLYELELPSVNNKLHIAKIRKKNTQLFEFTSKIDDDLGIYIDLFPLDNSMPNTKKGKRQELRLFYLFRLKGFMYPSELKHVSSKIKTLIKYFMFIILFPFRLFYTKKRLFNKIEKTVKKFNDNETGYVCELSHGMIKGKYLRNSYSLLDLEETVSLPFEQYEYIAPKNYHQILTQHYGDYMKLPKNADQIPSHIYLVSFDGEDYFNIKGELVEKSDYLTNKRRVI